MELSSEDIFEYLSTPHLESTRVSMIQSNAESCYGKVLRTILCIIIESPPLKAGRL
jgi:hypothetical protein